MITIELCGGLGNQLFQYALGRRLSLDHNVGLIIDVSAFRNDPLRSYRLGNFCLPRHAIKDGRPSFLEGLLPTAIRRRVLSSPDRYIERHYEFDENVLNISKGIVAGYWQTEKYFKSIRQTLLNEILPASPLTKSSAYWSGVISDIEAVSVHVRRGDYASDSKTQSYHGLVDLDWYAKAIMDMQERVGSPHFFFFSDDLDWVRMNFPAHPNFHFVDSAPDGLEHEDMFLMSLCKHHILANSSFSWWGAWLNRRDDKIVIAPNRWFANTSINTKDLLPSEWVQL